MNPTVAPSTSPPSLVSRTMSLVRRWLSAVAGLVNPTTLSLAAIAAPVVIASALAGRRLAEHMDQRVFEPIIVVLTVISALPMLR